MKKIIKNRKGFTLVELLAVIVILALIMSVAVVSMGSVMETARKKTFKETAASIIDGVRNQLTISNRLYNDSVTGLNYDAGAVIYFTKTLLDKVTVDSPMGGTIKYYDGSTIADIGGSVTNPVYPIGNSLFYVKNQTEGSGTNKVTCNNLAANGNKISFVNVKKNGTTGEFTYTICLRAGDGNYYIKNATYEQLMSDSTNDATIIVQN